MDECSGSGDRDHHQPKKTKLSSEYECIPDLSAGTSLTTTDINDEQMLLSSSSSSGMDQGKSDVKSEDPNSKTVPKASKPITICSEVKEPTKMNIEDDQPIVLVAENTTGGENVDGPSVGSDNEQATNSPSDREQENGEQENELAVDIYEVRANDRPRGRFRYRNYRLRSDSSGSERGREQLEQLDNLEVEVRRIVDQMNQEGYSEPSDDDDDRQDNDNDNDDNDDSSSTSSVDSDDSDTSPAVSNDDNDDDDSSDHAEGSDSNANEPIDVANLPFMKTADVKSNWHHFREIQLRQLGLTYCTKASLGGARYNPNRFQSRAYGSKHLVERLSLLHRLRKHEGCVNSLNFNSAGTLLASGSDDLKINLWNWQTNKLVQSISSGHRSNVFQTKFVEASGYRNELEIISSGRDGQVRYTRVGPAGECKPTQLFKQNHPIHKLAIPARCPYEILTSCEDGVIKSYDLRDSVVKKVVNVKKRLYSIFTHPIDNEFCVSASDKAVLVYDRRHPDKPIKSHFAAHMKGKDFLTITCAVYNNTGTEILASYTDEDIYLFDNVNHVEGKYLRRYSGHCNLKTIKGVDFFGPESEFVVSGSDCGNIFIWDKESQIIVNWMKGDDAGVVNCLEPHPEFPILATSGLDHDAKIWVPKGPPSDEHEVPIFSRAALEKCVRKNLCSRRVNRCSSMNEDRILDFLMFGRPGIGGRLRRQFSMDSEGPADGDGDSGGDRANGGRRTGGEEDDDDNRMILHCNPS